MFVIFGLKFLEDALYVKDEVPPPVSTTKFPFADERYVS